MILQAGFFVASVATTGRWGIWGDIPWEVSARAQRLITAISTDARAKVYVIVFGWPVFLVAFLELVKRMYRYGRARVLTIMRESLTSPPGGGMMRSRNG